MYVKLLLRLILGYIRIEVEGYYVERFINICTNKKILIWNLKREKGVKLYLNIGINDFKNIVEIAKKTNCKVKILKKRGMPFLLNRYKKRKIFCILFIIILMLIYISSRYVWNIEIKVENNLEIENISQDLETAGLKKGILKKKIDTVQIINNLKIERDDIAWVGIDIKGTNVEVSLVKADEAPEIIDKSEYCNIVATKAGIITSIVTQNGTALVNVGDTVQKGDILIAGYMEGKYTDTRYLHALGEVEAKVSYEKSKEKTFNEDIYNNTGKTENKYIISLGNKEIKLYKSFSEFELYKSEETKKNLKIAKDFYLPITITKIKNYEQTKEKKTYSIEEVINNAIKEMEPDIESKIPNKENIVNKNVVTEQRENSVNVTLIYEVVESIGESQRF